MREHHILFKETRVAVYIDDDGSEWFSGPDLCDILGIVDVRQALEKVIVGARRERMPPRIVTLLDRNAVVRFIQSRRGTTLRNELIGWFIEQRPSPVAIAPYISLAPYVHDAVSVYRTATTSPRIPRDSELPLLSLRWDSLRAGPATTGHEPGITMGEILEHYDAIAITVKNDQIVFRELDFRALIAASSDEEGFIGESEVSDRPFYKMTLAYDMARALGFYVVPHANYLSKYVRNPNDYKAIFGKYHLQKRSDEEIARLAAQGRRFLDHERVTRCLPPPPPFADILLLESQLASRTSFDGLLLT